MEYHQTPSFLRYQDLSIAVPLHAKAKRSPVKASTATSTGADAIFLSSSSLGTQINPGLPLALPGPSTYAAFVSSLTSLAFDPASTASILSSPSVAWPKYSTREATTSDGLTPSISTIPDATLFSFSPSATMPTTTTTTSQVFLTMPITTLTLPSVLSTFSTIPSSSTDTSTTTSHPITTSSSHSSLTSSTSVASSPSSRTSSSSTTRFFTITTDPDPTPSVTNVTMTHTVLNTDTVGLAPANSTSTVTTTQVITSTLQGRRTTVVTSVVESRALSTSDPVLGSRFSHNTGAIIGVAVSATLGVILSVFAVFFSCTRCRSSRGGPHRRRLRNQNGFGSAGTGTGWLGGVCVRKRLSPIPAGPIFTQPPRRRSRAGLGATPGRVNSSTRILGSHTSDDVEDDVENDEGDWRPPLAEDDDEELGRRASVMGGIGYAYGQGFGYPHVDMHGAIESRGVTFPTPPESGEGQRKSSHGHSQSWGHASSGHGHGHPQAQPQPQGRATGMENALLPPGSGIPSLPLADSGTSSGIPAVAPYVVYGYPSVVAGGVGVRNIIGSNVGDVGVGLPPPAACFGSHPGTWMGTGWECRPWPQVTDEGKQGGGPVGRRASLIGVGGLVTPRTSQGEDLSGSLTVNGASAYDASRTGHVLERGSGSASSKGSGDGTWTTTRVASSSTSSRNKSIKDVMGRFRTLSSSTRRNSSGATVLVRPASASAATTGGTNGGAMSRPGYDYGAIMRPRQEERAVGHYQLSRTQGPGHEPKPPPPVVLHPHIRLTDPSSGECPDTALPGQLNTHDDTHRRGVGEVEIHANEEESLDTRRSIIRDKLLDPYFLSPNGSLNVEGGSLRDYVDYSRRIGGMVKDHSRSTTTVDTVDQDGASGGIADPR